MTKTVLSANHAHLPVRMQVWAPAQQDFFPVRMFWQTLSREQQVCVSLIQIGEPFGQQIPVSLLHVSKAGSQQSTCGRGWVPKQTSALAQHLPLMHFVLSGQQNVALGVSGFQHFLPVPLGQQTPVEVHSSDLVQHVLFPVFGVIQILFMGQQLLPTHS